MEIKPGEYEGYLYPPAKGAELRKMMFICLAGLSVVLFFSVYSGYKAFEIVFNMLLFGSIIVIACLGVSGAAALAKKIRDRPQLLVSVNEDILSVVSSGTKIISVSTAACVFKDTNKSLKHDKNTNQIIVASIPSKYGMKLKLLLIPVSMGPSHSLTQTSKADDRESKSPRHREGKQ